jgi:hypothetical protein
MGYDEVASMEELGLTPEQTSRLMVDRFPDLVGRVSKDSVFCYI